MHLGLLLIYGLKFIVLCFHKMGDNSAAKSHLRGIESTLSRIDNMGNINAIINETSLRLNDNLSSNKLFIDEDIVDSFQKIIDKLNPTGGELITNVNGAIRNINNNLTGLNPADPGNNTAIANLNNRRNDYQLIVDDIMTGTGAAKSAVSNRYTEYSGLRAFADSFNLDNNTIDVSVNMSSLGTTPLTNLHSYFTRATPPAIPTNPPRTNWNGVDYTAEYSICDENGNKLRQDGTAYIIKIGSEDHRIENMNITAAGILNLTTLRFDPPLTNLPQEITLSISATYKNSDVRNALNIGGTNIVRNKTFKLTLNDGSVTLNTVPLRGAEFDRYNSPPGTPGVHRILDIIETNFNLNRYKREREALARALEGTQYATLNDKQKEEFYQRIRGDDGIYFNSVLISEAINTGTDRFDGFRDRFIEDSRDWNKGDNIKSSDNYIRFITNNVSGKVGEFISSKLDHYLGDTNEKAFLNSELTSYLNDIEENKRDGLDTHDINIDIDEDVSHEEHQIDRKRHWYQLSRRKDAHYMRFFSGSTTSLKGEVVDVHTNTGPEDVGILEPMKYDMDVKISGRNSIEVEIKIEGEKKPIRIKSGEPAALVRKIMRDGRINHGKARAHIGFNVYKAITKMAKEKDISLQYRDGDITRYIDINDGNIVVREVSNLVSLGRRNETIIFDQQKFINSNNFGSRVDNSSLRRGIDELGKHFTFAMNELHKQYRHGIERKFGTLLNSKNKMRLPVHFWSSWLSPIKKLVNLRDTTNFDFNTTITSNGKNVSVNLKGNKFTVNMEGHKPIVSKDLGKILNKRQKRVRIFDGMERDIVEGVYAALIGKLRENSKIANTDFGVMDNTTGNMFVLDRDGRFGTIDRQNLETEGNPLRYGEYGRLNHERLDANTVDWFDHGSTEEKELMKNPFLMQRLVKAMNRRLAWR